MPAPLNHNKGRKVAAAGIVSLVAAVGVVVGVTQLTQGTAGAVITVPVGGSWNACYQQASLGDVCQLAAGDYPPQIITDSPGKDTAGDAANVIIEPAPGAVVTVQDLSLGSCVGCNDGPDHLTIRNVSDSAGGTTNGIPADIFVGGNDANDILLENIDSGAFYINGAQNITIKGGDWGPCLNYDEYQDDCTNSKVDGNPANMNIVLDGITLHDYTFGPRCSAYGGTVDCHNEGLFLAATGPGFVLKNSRFWHNEIYDVFIQPNGAASGIIENNWFGRAENPPSTLRNGAVVIGGCVSNWLIRFNSFAPGQGLVDEGGSCVTNTRAVGNIFGVTASGNCLSGLAFAFNLWTSGSCGTSSGTVNPLPYVNSSDLAAMNYHLTSSNNFVTATTSDYALAADFDGNARSAPRDAGSDEFGGTTPPPPTTTTPTTTTPTTTTPTTTTPTTTTPPPLAYSLNAEYDRLETTSTYQRWLRANPSEAIKVETYWRSGGAKPVVATAFGKFLVNAAEEIRR